MQVTQKMRPALREQSGHKLQEKHSFDRAQSSAGCGSAPAGLTLSKKIAPRQDDSGGDKNNKSTIPQFHVEVVEHMRPNDTGSVTRVTVGKKIASCGTQTERGIHGSKTFQLPPERRQAHGAAQVTQVIRGKKNAPSRCAGGGMKTLSAEKFQNQHTPIKEVGQVAWMTGDGPHGAEKKSGVVTRQKKAPSRCESRGMKANTTDFFRRNHTRLKETMQEARNKRDALAVDGRLAQQAVVNGVQYMPYSKCNILTALESRRYAVGAAAKSAAEIGVSEIPRSRPTLPLRGFLSVLDSHLLGRCWPTRSATPAVLWRFGRGHRKVRRDLWGTGYANLVRAATSWRLASLGGRENLTTPEAAIMATVPTPVLPVVRLIDGHAVTSSLDLAVYFGKRHDDVIRKIRSLDCSLEFVARNFTGISYTDELGRQKPCYQLTRDGFFFVAMGFTGQRAAEFKEAYIAAFNALEQRLALPASVAQPDEHALRETVQEAKHCFGRINAHWQGSLYPALVLVQSPLAPELVDWFEMLGWKLNSLAHLVGARRPTLQGGRRHDY